ncbi:MAG: amino acid ABC transporter permease [Clostridia bacterium]|nr:amino acid ABC transporter permease [Clostridia bacterium]
MNFAQVFSEGTSLLLEGIKLTVGIALFSILIGFFIGLFACLMGISNVKILKFISGAYVWVIRGTPMIVQAFIVYFGVPQVVQVFISGFRFTPFVAGVITLSLNAGAYMSEIFRGGIQAVNKGQIEAARSLGMSQSKALIKVVLPQAFRIAIPSLVNQFIITIKDTSILSVIGLAEIVNKAKTYVGATYQFFATYIYVAAFYLVIISVLMIFSKMLEKRLNNNGRKSKSH